MSDGPGGVLWIGREPGSSCLSLSSGRSRAKTRSGLLVFFFIISSPRSSTLLLRSKCSITYAHTHTHTVERKRETGRDSPALRGSLACPAHGKHATRKRSLLYFPPPPLIRALPLLLLVQNENSARLGSVETGDESSSASTSNHFLSSNIFVLFC